MCKAPYSKQTLSWLLQFKSQPDRPQVLIHKMVFSPVPVLTYKCVRRVSSVPKLIMGSRYSTRWQQEKTLRQPLETSASTSCDPNVSSLLHQVLQSIEMEQKKLKNSEKKACTGKALAVWLPRSWLSQEEEWDRCSQALDICVSDSAFQLYLWSEKKGPVQELSWVHKRKLDDYLSRRLLDQMNYIPSSRLISH